jgi:hypothetical protein
MPEVKYTFKTDVQAESLRKLTSDLKQLTDQTKEASNSASSLKVTFSQLTTALVGASSVWELALQQINTLKQRWEELQEIASRPSAIETQFRTLAERIGIAQKAFDQFTERQRLAAEEQQAFDIGQQIASGDISEETGRQLETLNAEQTVALAEARGVADPVERSKRRAAVLKDFAGREAAIRNQGAEKRKGILAQERAHQEAIIASSEGARARAEAVPGLQAAAEEALGRVNQATGQRNDLASAQTDLRRIKDLLTNNPISPEAIDIARRGIASNPAMREALGNLGITPENLDVTLPRGFLRGGSETLRRAVFTALPSVSSNLAQKDADLKTYGAQLSAAESALSEATGGTVTTKKQAEDFRRTGVAAARAARFGAIQQLRIIGSQTRSIDEDIAHRSGLAAIGSRAVGALGLASQVLARELAKIGDEIVKAQTAAGDANKDALMALKTKHLELAAELQKIREQIANPTGR